MIWVFGLVNIRNEVKASYHVATDKSERNLLPVIQYYVQTSVENPSRIITDGFAAYINLDRHGYIHSIELHNRGFLLVFPNSTIQLKDIGLQSNDY